MNSNVLGKLYRMSNKLRRRRQVVHERSTMPQRLYAHNDVDIKKPEKLMLESKLAPCYSGDEECRFDHEECPICFLDYPSLNRSRCCTQGICTECFLQIKNPISARLTRCPFCKTSNYAVEDRGVKTKQEKALEQIEEQRVIEAKIRMRQREIQVEKNMHKRQELTTSSLIVAAGTSYESSDVTDDNTGGVNVAGRIVPESYEEQMMLAVCFFRQSSCDDKWTSWQ